MPPPSFRKIIFFACLLLMTVLSLWPSDGLPDIVLFPYADKLIHVCMYAALTFLWLWSWPKFGYGRKLLIPLSFMIAYGLGMEILQNLMSLGRSFDLLDEVADCLGFAPGWLAWKWIVMRGRY